LAEDEPDLLLFPSLRAGWSLRGQYREVPISGQNTRRVIFGAMNLWTGYRLLLAREHQRAGDFQSFLRLLRHHYRGWNVVLLLDEDSSHTGNDSKSIAGSGNTSYVFLCLHSWRA
jgi:hypothetical protein